MKLHGEEPSEIQQHDGITGDVVTQPREHGSGP
jgi:hypothetical protein